MDKLSGPVFFVSWSRKETNYITCTFGDVVLCSLLFSNTYTPTCNNPEVSGSNGGVQIVILQRCNDKNIIILPWRLISKTLSMYLHKTVLFPSFLLWRHFQFNVEMQLLHLYKVKINLGWVYNSLWIVTLEKRKTIVCGWNLSLNPHYDYMPDKYRRDFSHLNSGFLCFNLHLFPAWLNSYALGRCSVWGNAVSLACESRPAAEM